MAKAKKFVKGVYQIVATKHEYSIEYARGFKHANKILEKHKFDNATKAKKFVNQNWPSLDGIWQFTF